MISLRYLIATSTAAVMATQLASESRRLEDVVVNTTSASSLGSLSIPVVTTSNRRPVSTARQRQRAQRQAELRARTRARALSTNSRASSSSSGSRSSGALSTSSSSSSTDSSKLHPGWAQSPLPQFPVAMKSGWDGASAGLHVVSLPDAAKAERRRLLLIAAVDKFNAKQVRRGSSLNPQNHTRGPTC